MANIELKNEISKAIKQFSTGALVDNGINFFRTLGYETDRQSHLDNCGYQTFAENYIHDRFNFKSEKALTKDWSFVDIMFQLSKEEVLKRTSLFDTKKVDNTIIEAYLFVCVGLTKEHYSRTELSQITREINKLFPMPVMILFKYGSAITLSVINRRIHKRETSKDVLEKVTLIKDISIESPHRAHIEIFHDLAFDVLNNKFNFTNFVELHNAWQKVLDTKELNKKFFSELSAWYFWAAKHFEFPSDTEKNREIRNATSVIRLITRLMFVWFLKEKCLVPQELFDKRNLLKILKNLDDNKSTFYKAILQNLFFATLNTEMGKRKFRSKSTNNRDGNYFIHNVFRYEDSFNSPNETLKAYFENIPFLNGGLFECLDKEFEENGKLNRIRIDGFSDRLDNPISLPNEFFFCEKEKDIDLNEVYATKNKKYKFRGIIDILNSYKFTIDENTPIEEEIALDPELLGKVFENLLANYNPETQTTARKQTGSFYTPREIVNYMVDESLIAYLNQKLVGQSSLIVNKSDSQSRMIDRPNSIKDFTITKRHLPHWQNPGRVYFITFRTNLGLILNENAKTIIANSIKYHDKKKYDLFSYAVMPDHVHIILQPLEIKQNEFYNLSEITHSIKSFSANEINKSENQKGRMVWQHESFDRILRNEEELLEKMNYILNNPVKIGLIDVGYKYKWYYQVGQSSLIVDNEYCQSGMIDLTIEVKLRSLFSYSDEPHNFSSKEVETLINAIDNIKILDPACGSGAFPMGILHKLVHILHKLDPKNKLWKQRQAEKASHIDDAKVRDAAIDAIEEAFENNELDYGRKLYLIENCIYGIDIQPIAAQISKLRFFISLIVEQKANSKHDNLGVRPLPNLETKFVAANALIGLEKEKDQRSIFENPDIEKIKEELRKVRHSYFEARTPKTKEKYRNLDRELREKLALILEKEHYLDNKNAKRVSSWNPYDQNLTADFFEPEWMFGLKDGFDIVIGNPPYVQLQSNSGELAKQYQHCQFKTFERTGDIYSLFYEKGWQVLKPQGHLCFITSNKWMRAGYGESTRKFFAENTNPKTLIDFAGQKIFESATVDTNILLYEKAKNQGQTQACTVKENCIDNISVYIKHNTGLSSFDKSDSWVVLSPIEAEIKQKIEKIGTPLKNWDIQINYGIKTGYNEAFIIDGKKKDELIAQDFKSAEIIRPILRGRDIKRYGYEFADLYLITTFPSLKINIDKYPAVRDYLKSFGKRLEQTGEPGSRKKTNNKWFETQDSISYWEDFYKQKIMYSEIVREPQFYLDKVGKFFPEATTFIMSGKHIEFLYHILHSHAITYFFKTFYAGGGLGENGYRYKKAFLELLPIPLISPEKQLVFINLVREILQKKAKGSQTEAGERQIDLLVYDLYSLSAQEIAEIEISKSK